jgi:hypothetical protein
MGRTVEVLGKQLESADPKTQLAAARLLGSWATSGAFASPDRVQVEAVREKPKDAAARIQELATAQCTHAEIAAALVCEHGMSAEQANAQVASREHAVSIYARHGRAQMRAKALAQSGEAKMAVELARQYCGWSREGYADEVMRGVERTEAEAGH